METTIFVEALFLIGGFLIFIIGFCNKDKDRGKLKLKRCTKQTTAHITGFDDKEKIIKQKKYTEYRSYNTMHRKTTITYYTPYVEFEDESGQKYETKYPYPLERHLSNGQKINVKYNPENPYDFFICGDRKIKVASSQAMVAGVLMFLFGLALIFNIISI